MKPNYLSRKTRVSDQFVEALDGLGVNNEDIVVDVGCGAGRVSNHLLPTGARIFGLDLDTSLYAVPMARKVTGDANLTSVWASMWRPTVVVSCDAIRKHGVRLEPLTTRLFNGTRFAFKIQLADDLGGAIGSNQLYTIEEIRELLPNATISPLRFQQRFSTSDYLREFLGRVGLSGEIPAFTTSRVFERSYAIVTNGNNNEDRV